MPRRPALRIVLCMNALDVVFQLLLNLSYLEILGAEQSSARSTFLAVNGAVWLGKIAVFSLLVSSRLAPVTRWFGARRPPKDVKSLTDAARAAYRGPFYVGALWSLLFGGTWLATIVICYFGFPEQVPLSHNVWVATVAIAFAIGAGALVMAFGASEWILAPFVSQLSLTAQERGVELTGRGMSFRTRIVCFGLALAAAPTLYLIGVEYMAGEHTARREQVMHAERSALELQGALEAGQELPARLEGPQGDEYPFLANSEGLVVAGREAGTGLAERPFLARRFRDALAREASGSVTYARLGTVAYRRVGEGAVGVLVRDAPAVATSTVVMLALIMLIVILWAPISAVFIASSTAVPVSSISDALVRVRAGEIAEVARVPVFHQDEVGILAESFNATVAELRRLAAQAREVAEGDLAVTMLAPGELGDAFRQQVVSLRTMVGHITRNAAELAGAAAEMYAATQEQESAAQQQSGGVEEVSRTMQSLLAAATHIAESTAGVLAKAERTRETTSRTGERIAELSAHTGRIGEILDVIREIADRSDLLALNASLEGTRAGEAGRAFTLVAAEMRKLAERITASVEDIKRLIADVRSSVSATVLVTEESRSLADGTTESARQINFVTAQQRSGTEQAGQSMRDVAAMITQALSATKQIRALAAGLKGQADSLMSGVARFRLPNGALDGKAGGAPEASSSQSDGPAGESADG